jgi:hypothetical protein
MATSPLYNWPEPDNTDLVKNGALAIRTAVNAIDTSMGDLLGGTTGQVLSKASNTNMDFTWVTQDDANAIQNTQLTAKGALITAFSSATPATLTVGANDLLLTAASGEATGLKYTGAWTSFTPTFNNVTVGNATVGAKYCQIGKIVFVKLYFKFGSTSSFTGNVTINHPIAATGNPGGFQSGVQILDAGIQYYFGYCNVAVSNVEILTANVAFTYPLNSPVNATTPMTWGTNDEFVLSYWYEVA